MQKIHYTNFKLFVAKNAGAVLKVVIFSLFTMSLTVWGGKPWAIRSSKFSMGGQTEYNALRCRMDTELGLTENVSKMPMRSIS